MGEANDRETRADADGADASAAGPDGVRGGVSRRHFLTALGAVGATAAAGALIWRATEDDGDDNGRRTEAAPTRNAAGAAETRTLHFVIPAMPAGTFSLWVAGREHPIVPHTTQTRTTLLAGHAGLLDTGAVTHYAQDITFAPTVHQCPVLGGLTADGHLQPGSQYLGMYTQIPKAAMIAAATKRSARLNAVNAFSSDPNFRSVVSKALTGAASLTEVRAALDASPAAGSVGLWGTEAHWKAIGASMPTSVQALEGLLDIINPYDEAAFSLLLKHPEIINADPDGAAAVRMVLAGSDAVANLSTALLAHVTTDKQSSYGDFVAVTAEDGSPMTYASLAPEGDGPVTDASGAAVPEVPLTHMELHRELGPDLQQAVQDALTLVKNSQELEGISYQVTTTDAPTTAAAPQLTSLGASVTATLTGEALGGGTGGVKIALRGSDGKNTDSVPVTGTIPLRFENQYFRHLLTSVCFYDDQGKGVAAQEGYGAQAPFSYTWYPKQIALAADWIPDAFRDNPYFRPLSMLTSAASVFGVPVPIDVDKINLKLPPGASSARVFVHGMGSGSFREEDLAFPVDASGAPLYSTDSLDFTGSWLPNLLTVVLDIVLPSWMLLSDVYTVATSKSIGGGVEDLIAVDDVSGLGSYMETVSGLRRLLIKAGAAAFAFLVGTAAVKTASALDDDDNLFEEFLQIGGVLLKIGGKSIVNKLWAKFVEAQAFAAAEKAIPFLGEALAIAGVATGTAQVAITTGQLISAPKVLSAAIVPTYDAKVTIEHDSGGKNPDGTDRPGSAGLPEGAVRLELQYHLNKHPSPKVWTVELGDQPPASISVDVPQVPVGGTIVWEATLFTKEGWTVGHGVSAELPNSLGEQNPTPSFSIVQTLIPVLPTSRLARKRSTAVANGVGVITDPADQIAGTAPDLSPRADPAAISQIGSVTVATRLGRVGYTWQSNGKWYARAVSTVKGEEGWWLAGPYDGKPHLVFDGLTADAAGAHDYLLDPVAGGYVVRQASPGDNGTLTIGAQGVGWFPTYLDDVAYHPKGYLVGVNADSGRLHILRVATTPAPDRLVPQPMFAAGLGDREGHLAAPTLVTVTPKGTIVVLDRPAHRAPQLRAFALDGNPTRIFTPPGGGDPVSIIDVPGADASTFRMYLGLGSDGGGFFYLLSYQDEFDEKSWKVDVLDPTGAAVYTTDHVNAGRMAVDYWRTAYTVNYRPILQGTPPYPAGAPPFSNGAGVAEPSVSLWLTETPKP